MSGKAFEFVESAFLQFAEPEIDKVIQGLIEKKVSKIVIFPFFMAAGNHVAKDIPGITERFKLLEPDVEFVVTPHLGGIEGIKDLIAKEAGKH